MALQQTTFKEFFGKVFIAHNQFCIWLSINNELAKLDQQATVKNDLFWQIILPTLQQSWILALARILDKPSYNQKKERSRLSLDYISEQLADPEVSSLIEEVKQKNKDAIESIRHHRKFIAHNPINELRDPQIATMGALFDDLEKTIIKMGKRIDNGFRNNSLYGDTQNQAELSAKRLFEAIMDWHKKTNLF